MDLKIEGFEPSSLFQIGANEARSKSQKIEDFDKGDSEKLQINQDREPKEGIYSAEEEKNTGANELLVKETDSENVESLKSAFGGHDLKFELKETTNEEGVSTRKLVVSVVDKDTGEVIRQVPPEEIESLFSGQSKGSIVDKKG